MKKGEDIVRKREVKAILFDMDGVLVDSIDAWFYTVNDTLQHFHFRKFSFSDFRKNFGTAIEKDAKTIYHGAPVKEIAAYYDKRFKIRISKVRLFKDTIPALKFLREKKIKLALLTNSTRYITNSILTHFNIKKYFDAVVTGEDVRHGKPSPDLVIEACRRIKVRPKDAMLVGDTMNDMLAGKRAGCITIGFKTNGNYRINNLKEISAFLKN